MLPAPGTFLVLPRLLGCYRILIAITGLISASATFADEPLRDPWQAARNLDYKAAADTLARQYEAKPGDSRITCAYAASLLVREPVTAANVEQARSLLGGVIAQAPSDDPQYRPLALYLSARLDQDHVSPVRLDAAQAQYEQLRREYPTHPLSDEAAVQLGFLRALQLPSIDPVKVVAMVEELLATVSTPAARRELHHLIAYLHWQVRHDAAAALPHYIAGREIGFETPYRNSELDLTIAGLAQEIGRNTLAAQHYRAFAKANPGDTRTQTALRLAAEAQARTEPQP
jgi:hypothetical protein